VNKQEAKQVKITTQPVGRLVVEYAIPSMVCMLVSNIYNLIDTAFVGHIDTQSTAAIGIVFPFMALIQSFSFYFGHGSGNYISRALGAKKSEDASVMAAAGFFSALMFSVVIAIIGFLFAAPVLNLLGSTPTILPYATGYFKWILLGTPFISGCFVLNNQMRHQGNAMFSMYGILSGAILNIFLDYLLIFCFNMGVAGAGLATALSQAVSFFIMLSLCGRNGGIKIDLKKYRMSRKIFWDINAGGLPSLCRQSLMCIAAICLNNLANDFGDESVAAFSIVSRVVMFATAALLGFGQGFQPVCGFNFGAGLYDRVRRAFMFAVKWSVIYCTILTVIGEAFAPSIIAFFRSDAEVVRIGTMVLRWHASVLPLIGFVIPVNMMLQTIRRVVPAVIVALSRQGLFLLPLLFIGHALFGLSGIIVAQTIADVFSFILCVPLTVSALRGMGRDKESI